MTRMKKLFALCLALLLLPGLLPMAARGADTDVGFTASVSDIQAGESFTVTLTVPPLTNPAAAASFRISFDPGLFELTEFTPPSIPNISIKGLSLIAPPRTYTEPLDANAKGFFACSWLGHVITNIGTTYSNTLNLKFGATVQATFTAREGVMGAGSFTIETAEVFKYNDATSEMENMVTLPEAATVWVDLYDELTSVSVTGLNAPAKGALLDKTINSISGVNAEVDWFEGTSAAGTPVSGFAKENQVYTVKVVLTAQPGRRFAPDVTVPGFTCTRDSDTQLTLKKTYPATESRAIVRLTVDRRPDVTAYVHGDALNTAGMQVTATYDDGVTLPVSGYTLDYPSGSTLRAGDTAVTLTYGGMSTQLTGLSVAKKSLTVSGISAVNRAYDGTTAVALTGGVLSGAVSGEDVYVTVPRSGAVQNANAGTGKAVILDTIYLFGTDAGYYTLTQPSLTVDIAKADLTVGHFNVTRPAGKVYDKRPATVTKPALKGAYQSEGLTVALFCNGEAMETAPSAAGYYQITFTVPDGGANFNAHPAAMTVGGLTITKGMVTVAGSGAASGTYGQTLGNLRITGLAADAAGSWAFDAPDTVLYAGASAQAATFTPTDENYNTAAANVAVTIGAAEQAPAVTASADLTRGGGVLDLSTLVTGAQGTVSFAVKSGSAATLSGTKLTSKTDATGDVVITVSITGKDLNGDGTPEYAPWTGDGAITVHIADKADARVSVSGSATVTKTYGDGAFSLTASAAVPGSGAGNWTWSSSNPAAATVDGSGKVTLKGAGSTVITAKYESATSLGQAAVSLTVKKAALTVTAKNKSITYGDAPAGAGVTCSGFVNGETEAVLTGTLGYAFSYARYGAVGTYDITPKGLGAANYDITYAKGTLTVGQKTVGISWGDAEFLYDGTPKAPAAAATGLVNGDECTVTVTGAQTEPGTYTATAAALSNANYKLPASGLTKDFIIRRPPPTLTGSVSGNKLSYALTNVPAGSMLIAARYEDGRMTWAKTVSDPGASGTLTAGGSGGGYRLFLVDGSGCRPLCPAWWN